jgi:hypothetical protein
MNDEYRKGRPLTAKVQGLNKFKDMAKAIAEDYVE